MAEKLLVRGSLLQASHDRAVVWKAEGYQMDDEEVLP